MSDLIERARAWAAEDPDLATRAELEALIDQGESDELADRFAGTLEFGTAGLRGALGAGPNRMNRVVVTRAGLRALVLPRPLPTPLLAFAIRELGCVAGVMVTASHNPPQDNGYKVYLGDGSQIVPPADAEIAARIERVGPLADVPRGTS